MADRARRRPRRAGRAPPAARRAGRRRGRGAHGVGRRAGQGHADRLDDPAAPRGGAQRRARRARPRGRLKEIYDTLDPRARLGPVARPARRARTGWPSRSARATEPSDAELRIAQAQLVGWLEGLFHGIQATLFAQQMAARSQLEDMRRQLPPGAPGPGGACRPGPGRRRRRAARRLPLTVPWRGGPRAMLAVAAIVAVGVLAACSDADDGADTDGHDVARRPRPTAPTGTTRPASAALVDARLRSRAAGPPRPRGGRRRGPGGLGRRRWAGRQPGGDAGCRTTPAASRACTGSTTTASVQRVDVTGAEALDWEDLAPAVGGDHAGALDRRHRRQRHQPDLRAAVPRRRARSDRHAASRPSGSRCATPTAPTTSRPS